MYTLSCVLQEAPWLCRPSCMSVLSILPCGFFVDVMLQRECITCMKSLYSHNLSWNKSQVHHYWLLLFSRLSKLEKETRNCLESGTQTEQEEESSEAVSTCPHQDITAHSWPVEVTNLRVWISPGSTQGARGNFPAQVMEVNFDVS